MTLPLVHNASVHSSHLYLLYVCFQDFADSMMDVKCAINELETCATFKYLLACLLAVGNFLNQGKGEVRTHMYICMCMYVLVVCM